MPRANKRHVAVYEREEGSSKGSFSVSDEANLSPRHRGLPSWQLFRSCRTSRNIHSNNKYSNNDSGESEWNSSGPVVDPTTPLYHYPRSSTASLNVVTDSPKQSRSPFCPSRRRARERLQEHNADNHNHIDNKVVFNPHSLRVSPPLIPKGNPPEEYSMKRIDHSGNTPSTAEETTTAWCEEDEHDLGLRHIPRSCSPPAKTQRKYPGESPLGVLSEEDRHENNHTTDNSQPNHTHKRHQARPSPYDSDEEGTEVAFLPNANASPHTNTSQVHPRIFLSTTAPSSGRLGAAPLALDLPTRTRSQQETVQKTPVHLPSPGSHARRRRPLPHSTSFMATPTYELQRRSEKGILAGVQSHAGTLDSSSVSDVRPLREITIPSSRRPADPKAAVARIRDQIFDSIVEGSLESGGGGGGGAPTPPTKIPFRPVELVPQSFDYDDVSSMSRSYDERMRILPMRNHDNEEEIVTSQQVAQGDMNPPRRFAHFGISEPRPELFQDITKMRRSLEAEIAVRISNEDDIFEGIEDTSDPSHTEESIGLNALSRDHLQNRMDGDEPSSLSDSIRPQNLSQPLPVQRSRQIQREYLERQRLFIDQYYPTRPYPERGARSKQARTHVSRHGTPLLEETRSSLDSSSGAVIESGCNCQMFLPTALGDGMGLEGKAKKLPDSKHYRTNHHHQDDPASTIFVLLEKSTHSFKNLWRRSNQ